MIGRLGKERERKMNFFFFNDTATTEIYTLSLHDALPILRVVIAVDPSGAGDEDILEHDAIGIVAAGLGIDGNAYILEDNTVRVGPATWGKVATDTYDRRQADMIVGEINYGGAMVKHVIQTARPRTPYQEVREIGRAHV